MIKTENETTTVTCGNAGKGAIAVSSGDMKLIIQMLATNKDIGDDLAEEDAKELPKVQVDFFDPKSIDVFIKALQEIKNNYFNKYGIALAC